MAIKSSICDTTHRKSAEVDIADGEKRALVVSERPLIRFENDLRFFFNDNFGIDMNQNGVFGGTPIKIHNGIDNILWTASAIVGGARWDFSSTDQAHTGSQSVDGTQTINNDVVQFDKGSNQVLTGYVAITGWVYIAGWAQTGTKQLILFGWDTGTVSMVGNSVDLSAYIDINTFNVWQKFVIPLGDLSLTNTTIDAIRIQSIDIGGGAAINFYLDDFQIEQTGLPIEFTLKPDMGTWLYVSEIKNIFIDDVDTTLINASMPNLSYNTILSVPALETGLIYQRTKDRKSQFTIIIKQLSDYMQIPGTQTTQVFGDGTNTIMTINFKFAEPLLLKSERRDKITITIADDLTSLILFRVSSSGKVETRR